MPEEIPKPPKAPAKVAPSPPAWLVLGLLVAAFITTVVLGVTGVLGEESVSRLMLGIVALVALVVRRQPPSAPGVLVAVAAGEIAGEIVGALHA